MKKHTVIVTKPDGTTIEFQFSDEDKVVELVQYLIEEKGFEREQIKTEEGQNKRVDILLRHTN